MTSVNFVNGIIIISPSIPGQKIHILRSTTSQNNSKESPEKTFKCNILITTIRAYITNNEKIISFFLWPITQQI